MGGRSRAGSHCGAIAATAWLVLAPILPSSPLGPLGFELFQASSAACLGVGWDFGRYRIYCLPELCTLRAGWFGTCGHKPVGLPPHWNGEALHFAHLGAWLWHSGENRGRIRR